MRALMKKFNNREDGFTLIELLIVVLIIGILAAVSIPVYLGIQNQAHKSAIKADVNVAVKQVQVSLTEGQNITALYGTKNGSDKGETVQVKASTTSGASANDFMVVGAESALTGAVNYTYTYDSFTGQFTDSDASVALGGGNTGGTGGSGTSNIAPTITSATPTPVANVGSTYTYTVVATGTPNPTYAATGLPTGLSIQAITGVISGTPTTAGTYNYTITATNGTSPDATQTGTITIYNYTPTVVYSQDFEAGTGSDINQWGYSATSAGYDAINSYITTGNMGTPSGCHTASTYCAASNPTSATNGQTAMLHGSTLISGATYKFEGWVRAANNTNVIGTVTGVSSLSSTITPIASTPCTLTGTGTTWCKVSFTYTYLGPSGTQRWGVAYTYPTTGTTTANTLLYLDDVTLTRLN